MKDLLAGVGAVVFFVGCYLLARMVPASPESISAIQFWSAFAVATLGCVIFCAADPFFE